MNTKTTYIIALLMTQLTCHTGVFAEEVGTLTTIRDIVPIPDCPLDRVNVSAPVTGLFVGVSNYGARASGIWSTPAHTLGAAMMLNLFVPDYPKRQSNLGITMLAGLRLPPAAPENFATLGFLSSLVGQSRINPYETLPGPGSIGAMPLNSDGTFPFFGNNALVTKTRIENAIKTTLSGAKKSVEADPESLVVFYFAAHGRISDEGVPYLIPADADSKDSNTWMSLESILRPIYEFARDGNPQNPPKQILIIFDICQHTAGDKYVSPKTLPIPPGIVLVQSASAGQYAWHYLGKRAIVQDIEKSTSAGSSKLPATRLHFEWSSESAMSVFPLAARCSLSKRFVTGADKLSPPPFLPPIKSVSWGLGTWLGNTKEIVSDYVNAIPLAARNNNHQDIDIQYGISAGKESVFSTVPILKNE